MTIPLCPGYLLILFNFPCYSSLPRQPGWLVDEPSASLRSPARQHAYSFTYEAQCRICRRLSHNRQFAASLVPFLELIAFPSFSFRSGSVLIMCNTKHSIPLFRPGPPSPALQSCLPNVGTVPFGRQHAEVIIQLACAGFGRRCKSLPTQETSEPPKSPLTKSVLGEHRRHQGQIREACRHGRVSWTLRPGRSWISPRDCV